MGTHGPPILAGMATRAVPRPLAQLPNALTIVRLVALVPFCVLLARAEDGQSVAAGLLFGAASLTDWFDGWLARRLGVQSRFGRLADPLADRLVARRQLGAVGDAGRRQQLGTTRGG